MGWVRSHVEDIPIVGPAINKVTEVVSDVATAPFEKSGFNDAAEAFIDDPVQAISNDLAKFDDVILQPVTEPISKIGTQIDDKVNEVIPGGWATVAQIALSFAAPGLGTALGTAVLGAGASTFAAATLGGAMLGAGTGALTASLRGGDPLKGALAGAAGGAFGGAVSTSGMDIATSIVGGGDQVAGLMTLQEMSASTGISVTKLSNVISNSVASGIAGAATGKGDVGTLIGTSLAASGIGAYAGSIVNGIDPGQLNSAVAATSSIANIGTRAALGGNDIGDAIIANAPSVLGSAISAEFRPTASQKTNDANKSITTSMWGEDTSNKYGDINFAGDYTDKTPGTKIILADGSTGIVSNSGVIVPEGTLPDTTSVVYKEPTGTVSLEDIKLADDAIIQNGNSPSGFSDSKGNPINEDGSPYLEPKPVDNEPTSPLSPNPADQQDLETYFQALLSQGIEPALATKMSGYSPAGTGVLPSDGTGTPDGTGTVTPPLTPPLSTVPTIPTNPDLKAGELIVEGTIPKPYEPFESDFPTQPDTTTLPVTTTPPATTTPTAPIKIPTTTPTTTITTKPTGALPTATDSSFSMPSTGAQATPAVTAPLSISATSLAGAPVYNNNPQLLAELKQLYPQLSTLNPKLLNMLGVSPQGTPPLSQSAQVAQAQNQNDLMTNFMGKGISSNLDLPSFADGGHIHGMEYGQSPKFITGATGHYVKGAGDGQSDDIPALLADGEYVFDADTVAQLGNGSSDAGAKFLDHFRQAVREHKRSAPVDKIPPKASPLAYMKEALKRHSKG